MQATYFQHTFPLHQKTNDRERLATYVTPPDPCWFSDTLDWSAAGGLSSISWSSSQTTTTNNSLTVEFKMGAEIAGLIGFGVQGSFDVQTETSTTVTTASTLNVDCPAPGPLTDDPIKDFSVYARWLKPSASGFWVPWNRQGSGDQPWFITYGLVPNSIQ
jgi:hypothetical protein